MRHTPHYPALDGLRGFASISVVLFHLGHWLHVPGLAANSGLAVDFFFCLSGYVLGLAYEARLRGPLTVGAFVRLRAVRLLPLTVLATLVSFAFVLLRTTIRHEAIPAPVLLTAVTLGLLNLPMLFAPAVIGGPQVFPLNGPQYSLFLELLVNLAWATGRRLPPLPVALAIAGVSFVGVTTLGFGGDSSATFWRGLPRVALSFYLGVAAVHLRGPAAALVKRRGVFLAALLLMAALFYTPVRLPFGVYLVWVIAVAPTLVVAGSAARFGQVGDAVALWLGELSFPLYALHYPIFCWVNGLYQIVFRRQDAAVEIGLALAAAVAGSWLALRLYDVPVRRRLSRRPVRRDADAAATRAAPSP